MIKIQAVQLSPPIATKIATLHPEELFRGECLIGSSPNCHLVLNDPEVCGIHGKIFCQQQQYYFADLASGQGSLINDDVVQINQSYLLKMGDLLRLGDSALLVESVVLGREGLTQQQAIDRAIPTNTLPANTIPATPNPIAPAVTANPASNWTDNLLVRCVNVIDETHDVKTFCFRAEPSVQFVFQPGQFITVKLEIGGKAIYRPYSISSSPAQPNTLEITVKRQPAPADQPMAAPGLVSNWLHDHLTIGGELEISRPLGTFTCSTSPTRKLLLLSVGSGITPMMSMARSIYAMQGEQESTQDMSTQDIVFFHGARRPQDIIFHQELQRMAGSSTNLKLAIALTQPDSNWNGLTGRLSAEILRTIAPDLLTDRTVYVCGPDAFRATVHQLLEDVGFPMERYYEESFGQSKPIPKQQSKQQFEQQFEQPFEQPLGNPLEQQIEPLPRQLAETFSNSSRSNRLPSPSIDSSLTAYSNGRSEVQEIRPSHQAFGVSAILHSLAPENISIPRAIDPSGPAQSSKPSESPIRSDLNGIFCTQSNQEIISDQDDETILELAEREGVPIRSGCRVGSCGVCKQVIVEGSVRYATPPNALSDDDRASGCILPCVAYPEGRVVLNL